MVAELRVWPQTPERYVSRLAAEVVRCLVKVVDEAQALPIESLEELRMLSNFQAGGYPLLQIFLYGGNSESFGFKQTLQMLPRVDQATGEHGT